MENGKKKNGKWKPVNRKQKMEMNNCIRNQKIGKVNNAY